MSKQILILGGGYGGLLSATTLRKYMSAEEASITVVNKTPSHQIITELHRLAAGNLVEKNVALPLEKLLRGQDVDLRIDAVEKIELDQKQVLLGSGKTLSYDILVIALGSETAYFGIPGLQEHSFTLKSVQDANRVRAHVEARIDAYVQSKDKADATFVVGGGGLTGIELVGEFADMLPGLCRKKGVDFNDISIYCVEAGPSILAGFAPELVERAQTSLAKRGVQFLTGVAITEMTATTVHLKDGSTIDTNTLVWTGGVQGNSVVANCGIEVNRGRATVTEGLQSTSHPDVFLAGDSAVVFGPEGRPYPPTAQLAWQMGETIGYNIFAYLNGAPMDPFTPVFSGTLASLGRKDGIGTIGANQTRLKGLPATLMKEASNMRYLSHINGLFTLAY
ncbi:NAD(P)/FAD-dependent oxidoreductase [Paenibacillus mucilaginosus]|uniref:YjlD n=3 Tax=Paenibacillus mucilaginosus TaxID=61624 RepID=H6NGM9_9BACL|nr:NAD(P)/FAD-dependent oxidoreductase [Paenibacillus mucilaginosus]AEI46331.1 YjlD [Paenibacillus mucilaginosus KNP414]AFC33932.1 YjlD [Paenibacillus mucilaginosus 3016]AFH66266.1 pyridine nucleotide-disulfide oxidoreductase [Paenibacillus mucilaginosus K02]MCG7213555.1 NAD(P)/FAD-dependent oxidoreductase [Paenibacillus mucilaginosus]WDM27629.1 NAD(P)/FAD-dependent oxidoreductase [Paenibacillus mucilaginosus]